MKCPSLACWVMLAALAASAPAYAQSATGVGVGGGATVSTNTSSANTNTNLNGSTNLNYSRSGVTNSGNSQATGAIGGSQINAPISNNSRASASTGSSSARSGSSSAAITINNGSGAAGDPSSDPSGDPSGTGNINYSGSYTVRNVPELIAPSVVGGNPCAVGISGGVAVSGFGITAGGTWADRQCERRQEAALLYNIGQKDASVALLCQDDSVRTAINATGQACPGQPRVVAQAPAPAVVASVAAPAQVAAVAVPAPMAPAVVAPKPTYVRPDWCDTVSGPSEQARFIGQCRWFHNVVDQTAAKLQRHPLGKQLAQGN